MMRWLVIGVLILVAVTLMRRQREAFVDIPTELPIGPDGMPDPAIIMQGLRRLLDRYDQPEMWNTVMQNAKRSPGDLARSFQQSDTQ
jgi:hypothetical protein